VIYVVFILVAVLGGVGFGGYTYVTDLQERVEVLKENNAKLEVALETSEASIDSLKEDMVRFAEANNKLQSELQKAEAYGDELRSKLRRHNLTALAIRKPGLIEGRMNDSTANLWRELIEETGGDGNTPLPNWLQSPSSGSETGTGDQGSDQNREDASPDSQQTETSTTG
jgi:hypothetical protein